MRSEEDGGSRKRSEESGRETRIEKKRGRKKRTEEEGEISDKKTRGKERGVWRT